VNQLRNILPSSTLAVTLIDRSGSMQPFAEDLKGSFATYVSDLKSSPEAEQIVLAVGSFSGRQSRPEIKPTSLGLVTGLPPMRFEGETPLYSAVALALDELLAHPTDPRLKVVLNVLTDGDDTSSRPQDLEWLRMGLVPAALRRGFKLSVVGFGIDGEHIAREMGFLPGASISVPRTSQGMKASFTHMTSTTLGRSWGN
jgi:Mg-chelatase subunit ChlD